jgi:hypothetical protein
MIFFSKGKGETPKEKAMERMKNFQKINFAVNTLKESAKKVISSKVGYAEAQTLSPTNEEMADEHDRAKGEISGLRGRIQRGRGRAMSIAKGMGRGRGK